ncbi:UDP-glucosyltransferase 2 [Hyalella azteca]|uniref:UDP-glucuronosyltransferase n=1 Tax=Hyalella azteca TaxID=294128 RepID=A0A8B7PFQ5_HYAAZ|nr:UDP-glucosyltransferase 2 [Hyalella azteca]
MQVCKVQLVALLLLLSCGMYSHGSKILVIAPFGTKSHWQFFGEIVKTLANRGHHVTSLTSLPMIRHDNVTEIDLDIDLDPIIPNTFENRGWGVSVNLLKRMPGMCAEALSRKQVQDIKIDEYDLIFIGLFVSDCFYGLLEDTQVPMITMSPNGLVSYAHELEGNIDFPSFVPMMGTTMLHPLTFTQRLLNTLANLFSHALTKYYYLPSVEKACKEAALCRPNMRSIEEIAAKSAFLFINNVQALETPVRPYVPAVIHAGGLNCRPAQPLPEDLASWIEGSGDAGAIYFSLGSFIKPKDMPEKFRQVFVKVFSTLPQRVIWKWDEASMPGLPPNVKLAKWLPQQDILGHPKVHLFITHGGLFSTLEAIYHAVPILGFPVFADQGSNMIKSTADGIAETIDWDDLSEDLLNNTIHKMLTDQKYQKTVNHRSQLMRDQPMSPRDVVVYWTEYAIRHKGAPHLQSPVKGMAWYQIYNVDVWLSLIVISLACLYLDIKILIALVRRCCYRTKTTGELKKKKE